MEGRSEFDEVFRELWPRLYRRTVAVTGSRELTEEALRGAYVRLAARPERLLGHPEPYAYAFATVINVVQESWRRRRRGDDFSELPSLESTGGWMRVREAELGLLAELTPRQAGVVLLVDLDGFTLEQAAHALGLPRGTIAITRTRALRKLRHLLRKGKTPYGEPA